MHIFHVITELMGCNVSRVDPHGPTFPVSLRPLLLQRLDEIRSRRHIGHPLKEPTPSKKELLSHDENASQQHLLLSPNTSKTKPKPLLQERDNEEMKGEARDHMETGVMKNTIVDENDRDAKENVIKDGGSIGMGKNETREKPVEDDVKAKIEDSLTDGDEDEEDDKEDDYDDENERKIGYENEDAFPGSPSFRVYFNENEVDGRIDIGKKDAIKKAVSSDVGVPIKVKELSHAEKKVKRAKKRRSFRKVLPKNLLKVKSCYTSSHSSHDNTHLLPPEKTTT